MYAQHVIQPCSNDAAFVTANPCYDQSPPCSFSLKAGKPRDLLQNVVAFNMWRSKNRGLEDGEQTVVPSGKSVMAGRDRLCIVIGAGVSGLQAARSMLTAGVEVQVLEQQQDVGGIWLKRANSYGCSGVCCKTTSLKQANIADSLVVS